MLWKFGLDIQALELSPTAICGRLRFVRKVQSHIVNRPYHLRSGLIRIFVPPQSEDSPARVFQPPTGLAIPFGIASQFGPPIGAVRFWHAAVDRTGVPEAAIDENRKRTPREGDVDQHWPTPIDADRVIDAIPKSAAV